MARKVTTRQSGNENMLEDMLLEYDESIKRGKNLILSDETSRKRHKFSGGKMNLSIGKFKFLSILPVFIRLQRSFINSIKMAENQNKDYIKDENVIKEIASYAKKLGADAVGFAEVSQDLIYKDKGVPYKYAIVITMKMDRVKIDIAPSLDCMLEVENTYGKIGVLVNKLTQYIRKLGYDAIPGPGLGGAVDYPSLARKAGLGEYGSHGILISPKNGSCQRIGAVFTNIILPTSKKNIYQWISDYCEKCGKCIRYCPVEAIYEKSVDQPGNHKSCVNGDKCFDYFGSNYGCSICIKVCPFTKYGYEKIKSRLGRSKNIIKKSILFSC